MGSGIRADGAFDARFERRFTAGVAVSYGMRNCRKMVISFLGLEETGYGLFRGRDGRVSSAPCDEGPFDLLLFALFRSSHGASRWRDEDGVAP